MTLQSSGPISFRNINVELKYSPTRKINLGDNLVKTLLETVTTSVSLSRAYNKTYDVTIPTLGSLYNLYTTGGVQIGANFSFSGTGYYAQSINYNDYRSSYQTWKTYLAYDTYGYVISGTINFFDTVANYITVFAIPSNCTNIVIEAWGGGGGSGGSYGSTPGNGGSGGYATTTLTVGTHVSATDYIFCLPGFWGPGGPSHVDPGTGGTASVVWVGSYSNKKISYTRNWLVDGLNSGSCILCAGGGGGGGSYNWGPGNYGTAGHGGSGGYLDSGGAAIFSGSGTGASTTGHGGNDATGHNLLNWSGGKQGGYIVNSSTNALTIAGEAYWKTIFPGATLFNDGASSGYGPSNQVSASGSGGGGVYQGNCGYYSFQGVYQYQSYAYGRGGGAGCNKVYIGYNSSTSSAGISTTPPGYTDSSGQGYGGSGKGIQITSGSPILNAGNDGTGGKIKITFN